MIGNTQKPRDMEKRHAPIPERMGSKEKYSCDSETTELLKIVDVILMIPIIKRKAIPVI
ncbi:hypothetical protein [Acetivibrio straminisolvens]|jgi:hypothetical protein|uniref:hypothetical protein n=1 Tax=Acetivibrio straminisolvens TaxID=253314 RepID=UPI0012FEF702|nr:hypothetical protein [Acetivibrio straminisolvens]